MFSKFLKNLTLILIVSFSAIICHAGDNSQTVKLKNTHPCWITPNPLEKPAYILSPGFKISTSGQNSYFIIKKGSLYHRAIMVPFTLDNKELWYCPEIYHFQTDSGQQISKIIPSDMNIVNIVYNFGLISLVVVVLVLLLMKHERFYQYWLKYQHWWMLAALLAFHFFWIGYFISNTAEWGHLPLDETQDFIDAKLLMTGDIKTQFERNLGMALFYIPFIWLTNAKNIYDVAPAISWVMTLTITPLGIAGAFFIIKKLSKSSWAAFITMIIILLLPRVYLPNEANYTSMFWSYFLIPEQYILICYNQILSGFNSMGSSPGATLMLYSLVLALYVKNKTVRYITVSALFAVTCLIRIEYIFFSPLVAYIFWKNDEKLMRDYGYTAKAVVMTIGIFLVIYSPQLILNKIQSGGFFIYPYAHYNDDSGQGFELSKLSTVTHYMMQVHYLYYGVFVSSCLLIRDSYKRNILILWVAPMTIFFCGYWLGQPFRFLLAIFPGTIAALVILFGEIKENMSNQKFLIIPGILLAVLVFPELPIYGLDKSMFPPPAITSVKLIAAPILCAISALILWKKKQWKCLYATLTFSIVFLGSSAWLLFGLMVGLLGWTAFDFVKEIIITIKSNKALEPVA